MVMVWASPRAWADLTVPEYNSNTGAPVTVYLDFDGDVTPTWGTYHPNTTPAYSTDTDVNDFSGAELINIQKIWSGVAEKFSPFKINVTTAAAPATLPDNGAVRVVIGGSSLTWVGVPAGGIASIGGFYNTSPNTTFVFPAQLGNGLAKPVAEACSHESGHAFGLQHQSTFDANGAKTAEYNPGTSAKAPIMGNSYLPTRGMWWNGLNSIGNGQDDLSFLTSTGFNRPGLLYRDDDHGNTIATATTLAADASYGINLTGIIAQTSDVDMFAFTTPGGIASLRADVAPDAPMLDLKFTLQRSNGQMLANMDTSSLGEIINTQLDPGTYYLGVLSKGLYGDIGQYIISGNLVPEPSTVGLLLMVAAAAAGRRRRGHSMRA
jgi:hypothetical protein